MWNERYSRSEFAYGTDPNDFLVEQSHLLSAPVLSLGEGEGRNAVYIASLGMEVLGVDGSAVGLAKAQQLAAARGVKIRTEVADLSVYVPPEKAFNSVLSISAHLPRSVREVLYPRVERALKPGGFLIFEEYSRSQLENDTGGPRDTDMLLANGDLEAFFPNCRPVLSREIERQVVEGRYHTGRASVVQFVAQKRGE